jgi:glycosyltransferase involved in cell wall biosynthesis
VRILFLTQILPFPPDAGPRIKTWNVIRYLAGKGHQISLASFVRKEEQGHLEAIRAVCDTVHTVPMRRSRMADLAAWGRSQMNRRPFLVERDDMRSMTQLVHELVSEFGIEAIHADQLTMAQYAIEAAKILNGRGHSPLLIFDAHNATWQIVERYARNANRLLRPIVQIEARKLRHYEGKLLQEFDRTLVVSDADRSALLQAVSGGSNGSKQTEAQIAARILVTPIGIDTNEIQPTKANSKTSNILALGSLNYPPNADGIRWFANEVFPRVKSAQADAALTIVGRNPPRDIRNLDERNGESINVTGYVPDLQTSFEAAALMVVPVRAGGGMRVRILEGFARGMPMVTTTIGLEGIEATPGQEILVADDPEEFAIAVVDLLRNTRLRKSLAETGRQLVERKYDWRSALTPLDEIYSIGMMKVYAPA